MTVDRYGVDAYLVTIAFGTFSLMQNVDPGSD